MQSFLKAPNFSKTFFYKQPQNKYQDFCNAYAYYKQVILCDPNPNRERLSQECASQQVSQHFAAEKINSAMKKISECEQMIEITSDNSIKNTLSSKIIEEQKVVLEQNTQLNKLKHHANAQAKLLTKKNKLLEEGIVEKYNTPGRPSTAMKDPDLWDKIHDSIEFGAAHAKRRKEIIKVRTVKHLREALEEKYNTYLSRQCLSTYLQPRHQNTFAARHHHHLAKVGLASVARTEMKTHTDEHYCLASIKAARTFAKVFADEAIIISQDDKAKIGLGIPAVGRTFKTIQSVNELVTVEDHDFPTGSKMKLIPSVYLIINPADSSDTLRTGQLSIFIRPEYFVRTSSATHMVDLKSIISNDKFFATLKKENKVKPILILLVDGGPDENPKHMKNIIQYAHLFRTLDLDYLTVRTHAPDQRKFRSHLNSQGSVVDEELARKNFEYSGKRLCDIWERDDINGKPVIVEYIDQEKNSFGKDGHFINSIHALQYYDKLKIQEYDRYYLSISQELYQRLCCRLPKDQNKTKNKIAKQIEMECVFIPLVNTNFNEAKDIFQRVPWQEAVQDFCAVHSDEK
ncbi:unnamed protein product [Rhizophagus irregularis]|nr:unnamed protein product [Rhizophagus irregularis]